jgi:hypothetical protein
MQKIKVKYSGNAVLSMQFRKPNISVADDEFLHPIYLGTPDIGVDISKPYIYSVVAKALVLREQTEIDTEEDGRRIAAVRAAKLRELSAEYQRRQDYLFGADIGGKIFKLGLALSIKHKQDKGKEPKQPTDSALLDAFEIQFDSARDIYEAMQLSEIWINDKTRSLPELQGYDVTSGPSWPKDI